MSRTYKDKPRKFQRPSFEERIIRVHYEATIIDWEGNSHDIERVYWLDRKAGPKVKRIVDNDWHWQHSTPSWHTSIYMNRPLRRRAGAWEHKVVRLPVADIDLDDVPNNSKKPHMYYW